jgi:hypothetical protein
MLLFIANIIFIGLLLTSLAMLAFMLGHMFWDMFRE